MSSLWQHRFYYLFGFLALVLIILFVICAEISIALVYKQLFSDDHRLWWRSFLNSASGGVYVFLYAAHYFGAKLTMDKFVPARLYFGYMF